MNIKNLGGGGGGTSSYTVISLSHPSPLCPLVCRETQIGLPYHGIGLGQGSVNRPFARKQKYFNERNNCT